MRIWPLIAGLVLLGGVAARAADPLVLQASDWSGYSRLKLSIEGRAFSLQEVSPRQFDLIFPGSDLSFDTGQIFPGRRATRIVSARTVVDGGGSRLRLSLSCACRSAVSTADGVVTIDFHDEALPEPDEAPDPGAGDSRPAANPAPAAPSQASRVPEPAEPYRRPEELGPDRAPIPVARNRNATVRRAETSEDSDLSDDSELSPSDLNEIEIAQQRLLEQLTRAADQGLVEFREPIAPAEPDPVASAGPEAGAPEEEPAPLTAPPPVLEQVLAAQPLELPVRARSVIDKAFREDRLDTKANFNACIDDRDLAIFDWGSQVPLVDAIAAYRRSLLREFDQPSPEAVIGLVRLYAHHALGAEAQQILRLYGEGLEEAPLLAEMATILDGERPPLDGLLALAGPCSGRAAIWHGAARLPILPGSKLLQDEAALLDAFAELSIELRVILGPPLILNALDRGNLALAMKTDLLLQRVPGPHGPGYELVKARLKHAQGLIEEAEERFFRLAQKDGPEAAEALLLLQKSRLARGLSPSADMTEMLAMAAFMNRGTPLGRRLKIAEFASRAGSAGLPAVLKQIAETLTVARGDASDKRDAGHAILETSSAVETGAAAYARAVLAFEPFMARDASADQARVVVAGQLTEIGLANAALDMLTPAFGRRGAPALLAAARAYLAVDAPEAALDALTGLTDAQAIRLRAEALEKLGQPEAALETLAQLDDAPEEQRADLSWQAGAWDGATGAGPEDRRILAGFMAGQSDVSTLGSPAEPGTEAEAFLNPPAVRDDLTLRDAQAVRDASQAVRNLIEDALSDG